MSSARPAILSVVLAAALLTGCSSGGSSGDQQGTEAATGAPSGSAGTASSSAGAASGADSGVGVESADTSKVLAQQEYTLPGTKDSVKLGVQSLVVEGKTMVLKLVVTPEFSSVGDNEPVSIYDATGGGSAYIAPKLVDRENLKEYSLIHDGATSWSTEIVTTDTTNHQPVIWWGVYAAPEDDVKTMDLRTMPGVPEFTNVPIQR
ncbi:hypothetical protein [Arthrobacter sp.]|uniref:hypothetical protein n=1 Tax=Arthrobacter sp. TaxID=1667 RepID=UPI003A8D374A